MVQQTRKQKLRYGKIIALRSTGKTFAEISKEVGVSRQRVHQIVAPNSMSMTYNMPKCLVFACEFCSERYTYWFQQRTKDEWHKELSEIKCPHCGKKRL